MWIKKTTVTRGGTKFKYLQLMKTVYEDGRSRQLLVASLGREDEVDLALAKRLAESITDSTYLFLPDELFTLLPTQLYGETFLLNKSFELTSLRRFMEDMAEFKGLARESADALFLIMSYYAFRRGGAGMTEFRRQYFIRNNDGITDHSIRDVFRLLYGSPLIHPGLAANYSMLSDSSRRKCYYLFNVPSDPALSAEDVHLCVMTDEKGHPIYCRRYDENKRKMFYQNANAVLLFNRPTKEILRNDGSLQQYISRISLKKLRSILAPEDYRELTSLSCTRRYGDILYASMDAGAFRLIAIRSGENKEDGRSPSCEYLITNLKEEDPSILAKYLILDELRDCFYRIYLPKELSWLHELYSAGELTDIIINIQFLTLFLENHLSVRLSPLNLTASDAFDLFRFVRISPLKYGGRRQLIHSVFSSMQTKVLEFLAFE